MSAVQAVVEQATRVASVAAGLAVRAAAGERLLTLTFDFLTFGLVS